MSACHDLDCTEKCQACKMSVRVVNALAEVKQPVGADELGDMLLVGHIMAMVATMQQRGPLGRLHLCMRHREFALVQAAAMGIRISVPPHAADVSINAVAVKGMN